jgi:hypothetical protein
MNRIVILAVVLFVLVGIFNVENISAGPLHDIDWVCRATKNYSYAKCAGYNSQSFWVSGGADGANLTKTVFVSLPLGSTYSTALPFCAIRNYRTSQDDDLGWTCDWVQGTNDNNADGYYFTLKLHEGNRITTQIEAKAAVVDGQYFSSWNWWGYWVENDQSASGDHIYRTSQDKALVSSNSYSTAGADYFAYDVKMYGTTPSVWAYGGNSNSYVNGVYYVVKPAPALMEICQYIVPISNGDYYTWDSRNAPIWDGPAPECADYDYDYQSPLVLTTMISYYSDEKDFEARITREAIIQKDGSVWLELDVRGRYGSENSRAYMLVSVLIMK